MLYEVSKPVSFLYSYFFILLPWLNNYKWLHLSSLILSSAQLSLLLTPLIFFSSALYSWASAFLFVYFLWLLWLCWTCHFVYFFLISFSCFSVFPHNSLSFLKYDYFEFVCDAIHRSPFLSVGYWRLIFIIWLYHIFLVLNDYCRFALLFEHLKKQLPLPVFIGWFWLGETFTSQQCSLWGKIETNLLGSAL